MEGISWHPPFFEKAVASGIKFLIIEGFSGHLPPYALTAHGVAVEKVIYWLESHLFGFLLVQVHLLACLAHPVHPVHPAMNNRGKAGKTWHGSASHGPRTMCKPTSCFPPFIWGNREVFRD